MASSFDDLSEKLLRRLQADRLPGGVGDESDVSGFDPLELGQGVLVELEHTQDPALALEIAKDHLTEDGEYYTKLKGMHQGSRVASLVKIATSLHEDLGEAQFAGIVRELSSSEAFPTPEEWDHHVESFLMDAPNPLTEVVEPGFFDRGLWPPEGWDADDPDPYDQYPLKGPPKSLKGR